MDYLDVAEQLAHHQAEIKRQLEIAQSSDTTVALAALAAAQTHNDEAVALLAKLQAIDPSLGRLTGADVDDLRDLLDDDGP